MTKVTDKIKDKVKSWLGRAFGTAAHAPADETLAYTPLQLYGVLHPRRLVLVEHANADAIRDGAGRIAALLSHYKRTPEQMMFYIGFEEVRHALSQQQGPDVFTLPRKPMEVLCEYAGAVAATIDAIAQEQQSLFPHKYIQFEPDGAQSDRLVFDTPATRQSLQEDIRLLTHFNNKFPSLYNGTDIPDQVYARQLRRLEESCYDGLSFPSGRNF